MTETRDPKPETGNQKPEGESVWRFGFLASFLVSGFCILGLLSCHRERPRYNVLLITLDTFRSDRVGPLTPAIAGVEREGVSFRNADSPVPLTLPAHSSLLSGLIPPHHGLRNNGAGAFPAGQETLATLLSAKGWRTGAFVSSFVLDRRFGLNRGFDLYDDDVVRDPTQGEANYEAERRGGETVDRALAWLRQGDARPFFAWVHLYDAHAPYAPPAPYPQTYDGEVAYVDAQVARLLAAVDRKHTIVAIVGDHGESLGEHGELTHGLLLYEPTLHVPLIVAGPALEPRKVSRPVSTVDLAPTLAALAGVAFARATDGRDLFAGDAQRDLYAETDYPAQFGWSALTAMRRGEVKVIRAPQAEVYDLARDPGEGTNVLDQQRRLYREVVAQLDAIGATAVTTQASAVDAETRAKLASLGYVAPSGGAAPSNRDPKAMAPSFRTFEEATWAINAGRARDGIAMLEPLVRGDPANAPFRQTLARAWRQLGDRGRAIALYREAVAIAPNNAEAWYNLAAALQESGNAREAAAAITEAAKRDPRRPEVHNVRGVALIEQGDAAAAEAEFRNAIAGDPRDARAYNNLGNALRAENRADDAAAAYRQAIELAPRYPDPLNGLGALLVEQSRAREALRYFDEVLALAPDFHEARLNRAVALVELGEAAAARGELQTLLARLPRTPENERQRKAAEVLLSRIAR